jgi:hypothetical protein
MDCVARERILPFSPFLLAAGRAKGRREKRERGSGLRQTKKMRLPVLNKKGREFELWGMSSWSRVSFWGVWWVH